MRDFRQLAAALFPSYLLDYFCLRFFFRICVAGRKSLSAKYSIQKKKEYEKKNKHGGFSVLCRIWIKQYTCILDLSVEGELLGGKKGEQQKRQEWEWLCGWKAKHGNIT